jgi:hypothetical protein
MWYGCHLQAHLFFAIISSLSPCVQHNHHTTQNKHSVTLGIIITTHMQYMLCVHPVISQPTDIVRPTSIVQWLGLAQYDRQGFPSTKQNLLPPPHHTNPTQVKTVGCNTGQKLFRAPWCSKKTGRQKTGRHTPDRQTTTFLMLLLGAGPPPDYLVESRQCWHLA